MVPSVEKSVSIKVTNTGDAPVAGPVALNLYLSSDASLDSGDILIGHASRKIHLKPGKHSALTVGVNVPASLAPGNYELILSVDGSSAGVSGANPSAAVAPTAVEVQQPVVDLSANIIELPLKMVAPGSGPQRAIVRITNLGNAPARGRATVTWYLSTDTALNSSDIMVASSGAMGIHLGAHKTQDVQSMVTLPAGVPVGTYDVLAQVSVSNGINDSNPSNNVAIGNSTIDVVNVAEHRRGSRGRLVEFDREECVGIDVGGAVLAEGGVLWIDDNSGDIGQSDNSGALPPGDATSDPSSGQWDSSGGDFGSNDNSPPPDDSAPPPDPAPDPMPTPDPAPDPTPAPDPGGSDYGSSGGDF
ncbi:MAG TPA: hypothetical protein VFW23_03515 [Tepidisphaeraceae bacterium]|nr:hypothetical protein [Tepidisphaeraceae bacterium]